MKSIQRVKGWVLLKDYVMWWKWTDNQVVLFCLRLFQVESNQLIKTFVHHHLMAIRLQKQHLLSLTFHLNYQEPFSIWLAFRVLVPERKSWKSHRLHSKIPRLQQMGIYELNYGRLLLKAFLLCMISFYALFQCQN